ncbi:uncharacterized protein LOC134276060 [Saccostrea cucullata]|uniref:uncharacterized protein LOC134276060 n=1 Tax=Saccostrea cuccullata TaxID=36930 RepID=UPI002ED4DCD7
MDISTQSDFTENTAELEKPTTKRFLSNGIQSSYDIPVYGLDNGDFYSIHIPAITCISLSFISVLAVIVASFKTKSIKTFFSWTKSERLVVYLALCDGLLNISHALDHTQMIVTKNHVYPKELCTFYAFMLIEFVTAQNLMVSAVAFNVFVLIYFSKDLDFGKYDWHLLLYTFGIPCVGGTLAAIFDKLGPNGYSCYLDKVKGGVTIFFYTTAPLLAVLITNIILYGLTWKRIRSESRRLQNTLGQEVATTRSAIKAGKTMLLFVTAFFIQWWPLSLYGIWQLIAPVPLAVFQFVITFSNVGGVLNGIVYIIIRRRRTKMKQKKTMKKKEFQSIATICDGVKDSST